MRRKLSVGTWAYCFGPYEDAPIPLETVLDGIAELGFDGVSLGGFKPHAHPDLYPSPGDRKRLIGMIAERGLEVVEYGSDLWSLDSLTQNAAYLELFRKFADMAADCGFGMVRVDSGHPPALPPGMTYAQARDTVITTFQRMADYLKPSGIRLVWEFEPGFFLNKPSEILAVHGLVGRDNFGYMLDTCHAHMCAVVGARQMGEKETLPGGAEELISGLAGKIDVVHIIDSDNTLHNDDTSTHAPMGTGVLDFPSILAALDRAGYRFPWLVLDLCFWPNAWDATRQCKEYLDKLLKAEATA